MSTDGERHRLPKSMRHRRILDIAQDNPQATIEELASMVSSATPELVERVLEEHGDPGANAEAETGADAQTAADGEHTDNSVDQAASVPDGGEKEVDGPPLSDLSEKQREFLTVIAENPGGTQRDIADHFDVSRATVSRWADDIPGFEWRDRASFVQSVFESAAPTDMASDGGPAAAGEESETEPAPAGPEPATVADELGRLRDRIESLEAELETDDRSEVFEDPELLHKVLHACLSSDAISEDEELRILRALVE